jgi:hypothetical protein
VIDHDVRSFHPGQVSEQPLEAPPAGDGWYSLRAGEVEVRASRKAPPRATAHGHALLTG